MIWNETFERKDVRVEDPALKECHLFGAKRPNAQVRPSASDDSPREHRRFTWPAFQRCGGASRTSDGGMAALVSVLTRGPARGAPFLTKSVLISTF